jgi:hypothetical protein
MCPAPIPAASLLKPVFKMLEISKKNVQCLPQKRARLEVMRFDLGCRNAIAICIDPDLGYSESVVVVC